MKKNTILEFDTVKFVSDSNNLLSYNDKLFSNDIDLETEKVKSIIYSSYRNGHMPFELYIYANNLNQKLTIEFSSKILLGNYPQLICHDNFVECLLNIKKLGI